MKNDLTVYVEGFSGFYNSPRVIYLYDIRTLFYIAAPAFYLNKFHSRRSGSEKKKKKGEEKNNPVSLSDRWVSLRPVRSVFLTLTVPGKGSGLSGRSLNDCWCRRTCFVTHGSDFRVIIEFICMYIFFFFLSTSSPVLIFVKMCWFVMVSTNLKRRT